ncbi:MAG: D-glycero-alpha-D-manno-heptose-1,7-bisphosphate 7-phosphatase [Steroidobacteraceae bacterium]
MSAVARAQRQDPVASRGADDSYYVFLDRDGTLIRHIPYLCDPTRVELLPTVVEGLEQLVRARCTLLLHTNQSGIGRGYFSQAQALACNEAMLNQIGFGPTLFSDVCLCPEAPDQQITYRKPSPRYAREVMQRHAVDASHLCYIGDNVSDLLTARNVGCNGVGVDTGGHNLRRVLPEQELHQFPVYDNFLDAVRHVLGEWWRSRGKA